MCCLFGLLDHRQALTRRQRERLTASLSLAAQARGTDATGLAYCSGGSLRICKEPLPARAVHFRIPRDAWVVMGHTRMTTQGSAGRNRNNHPFMGRSGETRFALAHNGVLSNDKALRRTFRLPEASIETDGYAAVQLLERQGALTPSALRAMAETVEGSFVFTVLDEENRFYVVKGDNPFCLYCFPRKGCYVYASTAAILEEGLRRSRLDLGPRQEVPVKCGEILCLAPGEAVSRSPFDDSHLTPPLFSAPWRRSRPFREADPYLEAVKSVGAAFGYTEADIDGLVRQGISPMEIEELFYCSDWERRCF